jgi:hypothetical protein
MYERMYIVHMKKRQGREEEREKSNKYRQQRK